MDFLKRLINAILEALDVHKIQIPTPDPVVPSSPVVAPIEVVLSPVVKRDMLQELCEAISVYEGGPNDLNHRNCNPGNARYFVGGYASIYGTVLKDKRGFAIFKDWPTGMLYLRNMIKFRAQKNPKQTILAFMRGYAPTSDGNDPIKYALFIGKRLGVDSDIFTMGKLL